MYFYCIYIKIIRIYSPAVIWVDVSDTWKLLHMFVVFFTCNVRAVSSEGGLADVFYKCNRLPVTAWTLYAQRQQRSRSALRLMPFTLAQHRKWLPRSAMIHHSAHEASIWFGHSFWFITISFSSALFISAPCYILLCSLSITWHSQTDGGRKARTQRRNHQKQPAFHSLLLHTHLLL